MILQSVFSFLLVTPKGTRESMRKYLRCNFQTLINYEHQHNTSFSNVILSLPSPKFLLSSISMRKHQVDSGQFLSHRISD